MTLSVDIHSLGDYLYHDVDYVGNYDGDTIDLRIRKACDMGFGRVAAIDHGVMRFRLYGVDTYEFRGGTDTTKALAREARDLVKDLLVAHEGRITVQTIKDEAGSFGRYLALIYLRDDVNDRDTSKMTLLQTILIERDLTTGRYEELLAEYTA